MKTRVGLLSFLIAKRAALCHHLRLTKHLMRAINNQRLVAPLAFPINAKHNRMATVIFLEYSQLRFRTEFVGFY